MAQGTVKITIGKLVVVQEIDLELYEYKRQLAEKPAQALKLKAAYEEKREHFIELESRAKEIDLARKAKELDLKGKEQSIAHANSQLMTLKTNKEYQAKLFEIENLKADKSLLEEDVLRLMESSERVQAEIAKEKEFLHQEEKSYLAEKEKADLELASVQEKISAVEARRREAVAGIDPAVLSTYEQIVRNRGGLALVPLTGGACGGCFMHLPQQTVNRIKMFDQIVRCEMCARLLYIKEDL